MPIDGRDIIDQCGIAPGPLVERALYRAREYMRSERYGRDQLLETPPEGSFLARISRSMRLKEFELRHLSKDEFILSAQAQEAQTVNSPNVVSPSRKLESLVPQNARSSRPILDIAGFYCYSVPGPISLHKKRAKSCSCLVSSSDRPSGSKCITSFRMFLTESRCWTKVPR